MIKFTKTQLRSLVGSIYFQRGQNYYNQKRVLSAFDEEDGIWGTIKGSGGNQYSAHIEAISNGINSLCSCPIGGDCKHVAALGLAILAQWEKEVFTPKNVEDAVIMPSIPVKAPAAWEKKMQEFLKQTQVSQPKVVDRPFALFIDIIEKTVYRKTIYTLAIRPGLYDKEKQKPFYGSIKWENLRYSYSEIYKDITPEQKNYFLQLLQNLWGDNYYYPPVWLPINNENAEMFWTLLSRHQQAGVNVYYTKSKAGELQIGSPVSIELTIEDYGKKDLIVQSSVFLENEAVPMENVELFGDPNIVFAMLKHPFTGERFSLHPVTGTTNQAVLAFQKTLKIPASDVEKFQQQYAPQLMRTHQIQNKSQQLKLPKQIKPELFVKIDSKNGKTITLSQMARYGNEEIELNQLGDAVRSVDGSSIMRDTLAETEFAAKLRTDFANSFPTRATASFDEPFTLDGIAAARFVAEEMPKLASQGYEIVKSESVPDFSREDTAPEVSFSIEENTEERDWFDLNITIKVAGSEVPFTELFSAIAKEETHLLLPNGQYFSLEQEAFSKLKSLIDEAKKTRDVRKNGLSISVFQTGFWGELKEMGIVNQQASRWQELSKELLAAHVDIQKTPKELLATLRPYQEEGFSWLHFLYKHQLGGVLADDMGLGKTVQTIALMLHAKKMMKSKKEQKPFLVVAPTSVVENWEQEIALFAPSLTVVALRRGDRSKDHAKMKKADVVLTSYALLHRDEKELAQPWAAIILDEAQFAKNYQSKVYALIRKLKADSKIALTGTPMENNLMELWAIFSLVAPGLFPSPEHFTQMYRKPIEKENNQNMLIRLRSRIKPFIMRRKKELVAKELPPKVEQTLSLTLTEDHRHIYDVHLQQERQKVLGLLASGGLKDHRFEILRSLTKMRQLCLFPGLVDEAYRDVAVTKLIALEEQLETIVAEGHKVLIFSQFTSFLTEVKKMIELHDWKYLSLDGSTKNRGELLKRFQEEDEEQIFLISLKAGGFGLNLTRAGYCILLDPWWNPAAESQAVDRAHRIGQKNHVFVYRLIAKDTVEEKVVKLQEQKKKLFQNVLEDGDVFASLVTEDEIREIFE